VRRTVLAVLSLAALAAAVAAVAAVVSPDGRVGPDRRLLGNGRHLTPFGKQVRLGQFPTGGAVTPNGRWYWVVDAGRGVNDVKVVSVRSGRVVQTLQIPGASGGIAMDPAGDRVYVSGVADA
jgi:hypothetical protein